MLRLSLAAKSNMADELPSNSLIKTSIDLDKSLTQISGNTAARDENSTLRVLSKSTRKLIKLRLISQTPVVLSILDLGDLLPGLAAILALHNGEPNVRRLGGVVLPSSQKGTIRKLKRTGIEDLRVVVVGGRIKDLNVAEGLALLSRLCRHEGQQERNNGGETHLETCFCFRWQVA
jgi:hypothetical protein